MPAEPENASYVNEVLVRSTTRPRFGATVMPVTQSMGLPIEPLGLLLAVDTIPDVFATTGNVTGDLTATSIVARQSPDARDSDGDAG